MDAVMVSFTPEECKELVSKQLTVKLFKQCPKLKPPFKCYVYMKMNGVPEYIYDRNLTRQNIYLLHPDLANGRIVGEFTCDKIYTFSYSPELDNYDYSDLINDTNSFSTLCTGMLPHSIYKYGNQSTLYGFRVTDFKLYQKMLFPSQFTKPCTGCKKQGTTRCTEENSYCKATTLQNGPKSWCYVGVRDAK